MCLRMQVEDTRLHIAKLTVQLRNARELAAARDLDSSNWVLTPPAIYVYTVVRTHINSLRYSHSVVYTVIRT